MDPRIIANLLSIRVNSRKIFFKRSDGRYYLLPVLTKIILTREFARAHGMRTYEPRQGRNAATVVCSASAVVTLAYS